MHISPLIMAVRILDATYPKDQNPENWRTISGAKVHLDGNGDIDGGAGGKFTGESFTGKSSKAENYSASASYGTQTVPQNSVEGVLPKKKSSLRQAAKVFTEAETVGLSSLSKASDYCRNLVQYAKDNNVTSVKVSRLKKPLKEKEIIARIAGGDETQGSCASLALAYIANKCGLDVLDFRGDESQQMFSDLFNLVRIGRFSGVEEVKGLTSLSDFESLSGFLANLEMNKEYFFSTGAHAAIVKRTKRGFCYLELQSPDKRDNGWKCRGSDPRSITNALLWRFGCRPERPGFSVMFSVDSCKNSKEFEHITQYFNTNAESQQKGANGSVK